VSFLRPSNASYLQSKDMLRAAQLEVEQGLLHGSEYVADVEVWGNETHGHYLYRGQPVNLSDGKNAIYWYRVTIAKSRLTDAEAFRARNTYDLPDNKRNAS
jgi:hypothetical protein